MGYSTSINAYQQSAVSSASPLQLVIMLYDGAIRFMTSAKDAMVQGNLFEQNQGIQRAQKILTELMSCLDMQKGGVIASNLFALYTHAFNELTNANIDDDPDRVDGAMQILRELKESWLQVEQGQRREQSDGTETQSAAA